MMPENPEFALGKNENFLLSGVNPFYYQNSASVQEEQHAPLAASIPLGSVPSGSSVVGNIQKIIAGPAGNYSAAFVLTNNDYVYGFDSYQSSYGQFLSTGSDPNSDLEIYNNNLITTSGQNGYAYYWNLTSGVNWNTISGLQANSKKHFLKAFLDFCAVTDGANSTDNNHIIRKLTSSLTITTGIDIGTSWNILGLENYNNKYLAIAGRGGSNAQNYMFLWDGISVNSYNYALQMPGYFVDMKGLMTNLYLLVQEGINLYGLYTLNSLSWKKVLTLSNVTASGLTIYNNRLAINITSGLYTGILVYDPLTGARFVIDSRSTFACIGQGSNQNIYGAINSLGLFSTSTAPSLYPYSNINYLSQFIYVPDSDFVPRVNVYYDTPPVANGDSIQVIIYSDFDDVANIGSGANTTIYLNQIINSSYDTPKVTRLDGQGAVTNRFKVGLQTSLAIGSTWKPIIRGIKIKLE